ncbi:hypothetical protein K523DRAFT_346950 [Schizophyllum commune Tattone D]|nr:hypothetical protein K523DRAFT_346950 [Schizophyllum commune Tattone D]
MSYVSDQPSALIVPLLLVFAPIPVIVATRPSKVIRALVLGAQCQIVYSALKRNRFPMGDPYHDYVGADTLSMALLTSIHWYFLADPFYDGTRREGETQPAWEMPLPKRLWWATYLVGCVRGVGWNNTIANTPKVPPNETRRTFVRNRLRDAALYILIMDIAGIYLTHNPITSSRAAERIQASSQGPLFQVLSSFLYMANFWADSQLPYTLISALIVGFGWSEPRLFPPLWGSFWDAWTVRRMWSRSWHHFMRRFISSIGKAAARFLHAPQGSTASAYIQLYVGFLVSTLAHATGDISIGNGFGASFWYFIAQAVAITVEDGVIGMGKRLGIKETATTRALGRLWVAVWVYVSLPLLTNPILSSGRPLPHCLPFSPISMAWEAAGLEGKWAFDFPEPTV